MKNPFKSAQQAAPESAKQVEGGTMEQQAFLDLRSRYLQAEKALSDEQEKHARLLAKVDALERGLSERMRAIERAEARKNEAVTKFAADEITQAELDQAREVLGAARRELEEAEEVRVAAEKGANQVASNIPRLSSAFVSARIKMWRHVTEGIKAKIQAQVGDDIAHAWAAASMSGHEQFFGFVSTLFACPPADVVKGIQKEMQTQYLEQAEVA